MGLEIAFYPESATKQDLRLHLLSHGFIPGRSGWPRLPNHAYFYWFEAKDFQSTGGVEATIRPPDEWDNHEGMRVPPGPWVLHTRTKVWVSSFDKEKQNEVIRTARRKFGGSFFNDWYGINRYTKVEKDQHSPVERGIIALHESVSQEISKVRSALPDPQIARPKANNVAQRAIAQQMARMDPSTVIYNALIPFAVAIFEHYFSAIFVILLRYDPSAQKRLRDVDRKVDLADALAISRGEKTVEEVVAGAYTFQNLDHIQKAFNDWLGIDFWQMIRQKRRRGRRVERLSDVLQEIIGSRHGVIHRFELDYELDRKKIEDVFDTIRLLMDTLIDTLESDKGLQIRDGLVWSD
ncbi:MAG: hypothetical protein M3P51_18330 [Chloroflexota bacterium]|nr:hypothetical protein [Chloroflexota bacterium]